VNEYILDSIGSRIAGPTNLHTRRPIELETPSFPSSLIPISDSDQNERTIEVQVGFVTANLHTGRKEAWYGVVTDTNHYIHGRAWLLEETVSKLPVNDR
jgi:hypothetical protein